jgi:hypothetical protein
VGQHHFHLRWERCHAKREMPCKKRESGTAYLHTALKAHAVYQQSIQARVHLVQGASVGLIDTTGALAKGLPNSRTVQFSPTSMTCTAKGAVHLQARLAAPQASIGTA